MNTKRTFAIQLVVMIALVTLPQAVPAQTSKAAADLINAAVASAQANFVNDFSYNYEENWANISNDMADKSLKSHSIEYQVTFIDGFPYRRMVFKDRGYLTPEASAQEEAQIQKEMAQVKAMTPEERKKSIQLRRRTILVFNPAQLMAYYFCQVTGQSNIEHRASTDVECKQRTDISIPQQLKELLPATYNFGIDNEQPFFATTRMYFDSDKAEFGKDSTELVQWSLINGVWHHTSTRIEFKKTTERPYGGIVTDTFSKFVKSTSPLVLDEATTPAATTASHP